MSGGLKSDISGRTSLHLCVDMQRLFAPGSPWSIPWADRILPIICHLVERAPARTLFTRFIPALSPGAAPGSWARYYARWPQVTRERLPPGRLDLLPGLARYVPPARVFDKQVYSPWTGGRLDVLLSGTGIDTLIISGGETDVCVLATVLGAIDRGYRVILPHDGLCSSVDETHDALMKLYTSRFGEQIETAGTEEILCAWRPD